MEKNPTYIAALIERTGRLLSTESHAEGLLPVHWETLRYLNRANRFSRSPAAVTAYLGLTKGTVSQTLNSLEAKGLIKKQIFRVDRRRKNIVLTPRGKKQLLKDPLTLMISAIEGLAKSAQADLSRHLQALLAERLVAQNRQPFGQCHDCQHFADEHTAGNPHYCLLLNEGLTNEDAESICMEQRPNTSSLSG